MAIDFFPPRPLPPPARSPVQDLHEQVDLLQRDELVVVLPDARHEEEGGVALVHDLLVLPLDEGAHLGGAAEDEVGHVSVARGEENGGLVG